MKLSIFLVFTCLFFACYSAPYTDGKEAYEKVCANCHIENGEGLGDLIPPLANSDYLVKNRANLACILKHGLQGEISVNGKIYKEQMPATAQLKDVEITNILNYINHNWGNDNPEFRLQEVQDALKKCDF